MRVTAVEGDFFFNSKIARFAPQKPLKTRFFCLFTRCTPKRWVYKPENWHVGAICMWVTAVGSDFFCNLKIECFSPQKT